MSAVGGGFKNPMIKIRTALESDSESILTIFYSVVATEDTYTFTADTPKNIAYDYWFGPGVRSFVALVDEKIVGMAKLVANYPGLGAHVANASFMVDPTCQARGIGRQMGSHILEEARRLGFLAMQFNFVVSTNERAVKLWQELGFAIVGTLPKVFRHKEKGLVDAYVMHKFL